ncbi:MAG TPA: hypothetical protein PLF35_15500, partial [Prolixibacteraceae bacterium]|nr:hypothetical protein [Prolixibacteraceae bacterium]
DNSTRLVFLNPKNNGDTLSVNNENDFLLNWCWLNKNNSMVDEDYIANNNIEKYVVSIQKSGKGINNLSYSKELTRNSGEQLIISYLQLTKEEALNIGLEDGQSYTATVDVLNYANQLVKKVESPNFIFTIADDEEPTINIPVQALINYSFKGYPEIFPVINSEVIIEAFSTPRNETLNTTKYKTTNKPSSNKNTYNESFSIASLVARTNSMGQLDTTISIPEQYLKTDSIAFRIKLANDYYVDNNFELNYLNPSNGNLQVNFGTLTAKTYAYSLKLNVKKEFTNYKITRNESGVEVSLTDQESISIFGSSNQTSDQFQ